jgi:hypothetical protein
MTDNRAPLAIKPIRQEDLIRIRHEEQDQPEFEKAGPLNELLILLTSKLYVFFHDNGYLIRRDEWESHETPNALRTSAIGWIYAFYGDKDVPLYVGETGGDISTRFYKHKQKGWWSDWKSMKALPCPSTDVRKFFESILGLGGGYTENKLQPPSNGNEDFLDSTIYALLLLGYGDNGKMRFPELPELSWPES